MWSDNVPWEPVLSSHCLSWWRCVWSDCPQQMCECRHNSCRAYFAVKCFINSEVVLSSCLLILDNMTPDMSYTWAQFLHVVLPSVHVFNGQMNTVIFSLCSLVYSEKEKVENNNKSNSCMGVRLSASLWGKCHRQTMSAKVHVDSFNSQTFMIN